MAKYVGGTIDKNGKLIKAGLWEKEERQHTPVLIKLYQQLMGEKITPKLRTVRGYLPYPDTSAIKITKTLIKTRHQNYTRNSLIRILKRMMQTLKWHSWSFSNKSSLLFTFTSAIHQMKIWDNTLAKEYLNKLFGEMGIPNLKLSISNS